MTGPGPDDPFDVGDPSPGSQRVGTLGLVVGFTLAPLAWSIQLVAVTSIAGVTCLGPEGEALARTASGWAEPAAIWINIGALVIAAAGLIYSILNLRWTHQAAPVPAGGVLKAGEGRAHWMAVGGIFASILFLAAIAFNSIPVFREGLCPV